jgi:ABC-type branched-subunit amino acid transport system substrate-binding protein
MRRLVAVLVAVGLVTGVGVLSAGAQEDFPAVDQPGVTATEIKVGGVASTTNPLGGKYGDSFNGVKAYFDFVNDKGGIYGRELELTSEHDDQLGNNRQEVQALLDEDIFAVLPVSVLLFSGADLLAEAGIPTFGWNINKEWTGPPNLFGEKGSYLDFTGPSVGLPYLAKKTGSKKVAVLAYTAEQSAECAEGIQNSFEKYPSAEVVFVDTSLAFGVTDLSSDVSQMVEEGVDIVATCMDSNGVLTLAREMKKQGLDAVMSLPNAYDHEFIEENAQFFNDNSYVLTYFTPFEVKPKPTGLKNYIKWMKKNGDELNENSLAGWINADLLYTGLEAAGPDFTREKVIAAINEITDYTADGILGPVDWTKQHTGDPDVTCTVESQVVDGGFKPVFGKKGKPFICFPKDPAKLVNPTNQ